MHICLRLARVILCVVLLAIALRAQGPATQPQSVKPGINDTWKSGNIEPLVNTLEAATRDIYRERERLAELVNPAPGTVVADVGAGSGFMVTEFARRVGPKGTVYAVDINAKLLELVAARAREAGLGNVKTVQATETSAELSPSSVDIVFICDTYHHFEYPQQTMASIHRALRPGGQIVLVEFKREPGVSPGWVLEHVRAGKDEFTREVEAAGFGLVTEHGVPFLEANYVLRFRKRERASQLLPRLHQAQPAGAPLAAQ